MTRGNLASERLRGNVCGTGGVRLLEWTGRRLMPYQAGLAGLGRGAGAHSPTGRSVGFRARFQSYARQRQKG